jgi:hypothetical protein
LDIPASTIRAKKIIEEQMGLVRIEKMLADVDKISRSQGFLHRQMGLIKKHRLICNFYTRLLWPLGST